jgi:hypothetical protein
MLTGITANEFKQNNQAVQYLPLWGFIAWSLTLKPGRVCL